MNDNLINQDYLLYTAEDHNTWQTLSTRQASLHQGIVSKAYLEGFNQLQLDPRRIVKIDEMSLHMQKICGWTLLPVDGLIPTKDFFYMLTNHQYPITVPIRKPHELDFSEQPDIFHDVYGHLPLLTNNYFVKFLQTYSSIALKFVDDERAVELLGRLYWFTYEMGIIMEDGIHKPYGGAIITSSGEMANIKSDAVPKYAFDVEHVFCTPYDNLKLQKEYFVINSFADLFNCLDGIEEILRHHLMPAEKFKK
jgi:phenylalanine-4-hydroxylase